MSEQLSIWSWQPSPPKTKDDRYLAISMRATHLPVFYGPPRKYLRDARKDCSAILAKTGQCWILKARRGAWDWNWS